MLVDALPLGAAICPGDNLVRQLRYEVADEPQAETTVEHGVKIAGREGPPDECPDATSVEANHDLAYRDPRRVVAVYLCEHGAGDGVHVEDSSPALGAGLQLLPELPLRAGLAAEPAAVGVGEALVAAALEGVTPGICLLVRFQLGDVEHLGDGEAADRDLAIEIFLGGPDFDAVVHKCVKVLKGLAEVAAEARPDPEYEHVEPLVACHLLDLFDLAFFELPA